MGKISLPKQRLSISGHYAIWATKKGPFSRALQYSDISLGYLPVWDNKIVTAYLLLVNSNNLPIYLRVCAKMFTSPSMGSDNF